MFDVIIKNCFFNGRIAEARIGIYFENSHKIPFDKVKYHS